MEIQNYISALDALDQLQFGVDTYLTVVLQPHLFPKNHRLEKGNFEEIYLAYIEKGAAILSIIDQDSGEKQTISFYVENTFLPLLSYVDLGPTKELNLEFIEETNIIGISEKHYSNLPKLFTSCIHLYHKIYISHYIQQIKRAELLTLNSAEQRYEIFKITHSNIINRFSIKDIASFIGIHPNTLSAVRGKIKR